MEGIDPVAYLRSVAAHLESLESRAQLQRALDDVEYLTEVLDPELQDLAYQLHERIRQKLDTL